MLSLGIDASRAFWTALPSVGLDSGSPPPSRAATVIARASLVNCWPRRESTTALRCLIDDHFECPDMAFSLGGSCRSRARWHERLGMPAVPLDGPAQAILEVYPRLPSGQLPQPRRVNVLTVDLAARGPGAADVGLHLGPRNPADELDHLADGVRAPPAAVERLAAALPPVQRLGDGQVRGAGVLDVEEVPLRR